MPSVYVSSNSISRKDVLLGRGGMINKHYGNMEFRKTVAKYEMQYLFCKKSEKSVIASTIVDIINQEGGRFLKRLSEDSDKWIEVPRERALLKTSQALREKLDIRNGSIRVKRISARHMKTFVQNNDYVKSDLKEKLFQIYNQHRPFHPDASKAPVPSRLTKCPIMIPDEVVSKGPIYKQEETPVIKEETNAL